MTVASIVKGGSRDVDRFKIFGRLGQQLVVTESVEGQRPKLLASTSRRIMMAFPGYESRGGQGKNRAKERIRMNETNLIKPSFLSSNR